MASPTYAAGPRVPPAGIDALVSELSLGENMPRPHVPAGTRPLVAPRAVPAARPPPLDLAAAYHSGLTETPSPPAPPPPQLQAQYSSQSPPQLSYAAPRPRPDSFYSHPPSRAAPQFDPMDLSPRVDRQHASPAHGSSRSIPECHASPSPALTGSSSAGTSRGYTPAGGSRPSNSPLSQLATNDPAAQPASRGPSTPTSIGAGSSLPPANAIGMHSSASLVLSRPSTPQHASPFGAGYQPAFLASASRIFEQGSQVLHPGSQASLLSHEKTLELYRKNAKKVQDPDLMYELAVFMIESSRSPAPPLSCSGTGNAAASAHDRSELIKEAMALLRKISDRGHPDAQYFLADCYANGLGSTSGKPQFEKACPLFILAAKHSHADAAYRAGTCTERGWGTRKDSGKAVQFYRKAASQGHPGALFRLATAELNGDLGLKKNAKEGVKWIKLSADMATSEFPHALHELALLHERGIDNVIFLDNAYACELLAQAAELGYAPSAYKLGVNYEYGKMGCQKDAGLSIHMYNIAAQQNHKEACFALCAWYLVGAPGILPQSDTEAYLWAKKAAEQGMAKAEYAVGYFTETGVGTTRNLPEAKAWYTSALEHGDRRASTRLASMGNIVASALPKPSALCGSGSISPLAQQTQAARMRHAYPQGGYQGSTAHLPHTSSARSVSSSVGDNALSVAGSGDGFAPSHVNTAVGLGQNLASPVDGRFVSVQSLPQRAASPAPSAEKKKKRGWFRS